MARTDRKPLSAIVAEADADFSHVEGGSSTSAPREASGGYGMLSRLGKGLTNPQTARNVLRGATFGLEDEAASAGTAAGQSIRRLVTGEPGSFGEDYRQSQAEIQLERGEFQREHPVLDMGTQMAGALLTGKAVIPKSLGAVPNSATTGAKLLGVGKRVGATAGIGATAGALAGAGDPGEGESRPEAARRGALVGGVVGGGAGVIGETGQAGWQLLRRVFGKSQPGEIAERYLAEAGETVTDASRRAAEQVGQGKPPTVADAMGRSGIRLGKDVAGSSPQAADRLAAMGRERTRPAMAAGEIRRDIESATGKTLRPTLLDQRRIDAERRALAEKVYPLLRKDTRPINDPEVLRALDTDLGRQAYAMAERMARADATAAGVTRRPGIPFMRVFDEKGKMIGAPNIATLDWIKRGMDELLDVGTAIKPGQGASLSDSERGAIKEIRTFLMNRLDQLGQANPTLKAYSTVRKEQESAFAVVDWMTTGFKRFKQATIAEGQVTDDLTRLGQEAARRGLPTDMLRTAYRQAALDAFATRLRSGSLQKAEQAGTIRSLRALGIQPGEIDDLLARVRTTQERQELGQVFQRLLGGGDDPVVGNKGAAFGDIATGNVAGAGRNVFKAAHNRFSGITPGTAPPVADLLRQPADVGLKSIRSAERELFTRRNRVGNEALVAFLLGQQAGGQ
ncbi:MAG: hypothetical protein JNM53_08780 [Gemmatimonadetes bacterium]|nr:hypothetical protein [Gemmatimonadota bacterium]